MDLEILSQILNVKVGRLAKEIEKSGGMDAVLFGESSLTPLASRVRAIAGISREILSRLEDLRAARVTLNSPEALSRWAIPRLSSLEHEEFWCVATNARHNIISATMIAKGGASACQVDLLEITKFLARNGAIGAILAHNHPSGNPLPSPEDVEMTRKVKIALKTIGVTLLDHVIVGGTKTRSLCEMGII